VSLCGASPTYDKKVVGVFDAFLITLAYQLAASILQPLVGLYTDKAQTFSQIFGMLFTLAGIVSLSMLLVLE
jgi:Na+(H+)/acetate symporter ActP